MEKPCDNCRHAKTHLNEALIECVYQFPRNGRQLMPGISIVVKIEDKDLEMIDPLKVEHCAAKSCK